MLPRLDMPLQSQSLVIVYDLSLDTTILDNTGC